MVDILLDRQYSSPLHLHLSVFFLPLGKNASHVSHVPWFPMPTFKQAALCLDGISYAYTFSFFPRCSWPKNTYLEACLGKPMGPTIQSPSFGIRFSLFTWLHPFCSIEWALLSSTPTFAKLPSLACPLHKNHQQALPLNGQHSSYERAWWLGKLAQGTPIMNMVW